VLRKDLSAAESALSKSETALIRETRARDRHSESDRVKPFYALSGQCFSTTQAQYTYEMCFDGSAKQRETSHGASAHGTSLGSMSEITFEGASATVKFTGGATCWRGPARSLTVTLVCGEVTKATAVDEPSMCEYTMQMESPALCEQTQVR